MKITICGGGFGGVKAALRLAEYSNNKITLISDKTDFQYFPALYATATGRSKRQSWIPLGEIFADKPNVTVMIDKLTGINPDKKELSGESGNVYEYDHCVLALGAVTTFFNIKGLDTYAFGIKSAAEIARLKQHLFEHMTEYQTVDKQYVIVGGGPTGVELAATLGAYIKQLQAKYTRSSHKIRITLVEGSPRLLPRMHPGTSKRVTKRLKKIGVKVELGKRVEEGTATSLVVGGRPIQTQTIIWTSGVANNPFFAANSQHFTLAPNGKVQVDDYLRAGKDLYILGDNAATPYSGLAQVALHDAHFVADNLMRKAGQQPLKKYKAVMPPVVVPVGESWAAFEWRKVRLYGWPAAMIRRAADAIGYSDILPLGHALDILRVQDRREDDYFTPPAK